MLFMPATALPNAAIAHTTESFLLAQRCYSFERLQHLVTNSAQFMPDGKRRHHLL